MRYNNGGLSKMEPISSGDEAMAAEPGDIFNEMARLGSSLNVMNDLVNTLAKRLSPVLAPVDSGDAIKEDCSPRTDLGQMVRQHDYSARASISTLRDILNGLELP
jgi:hypothetical protein